MNPSVIYGAFFFVLSMVHSCGGSRSTLPANAYVEWMDDSENGLVLKKKVGDLNFELQYKPLEYVVLKDNAGKCFSEKEMNSETASIKDMQYFTFRISSEKGGDLLRDDISSVENFSSRLQYFSSGMQKDIHLIENGDTLACLLFHFERTYGIDPRSTFVLGFPLGRNDGAGGIPANTDKVFLFDDHELDAGPVYMTIAANKINQIPLLNLQ